jgi:hypothetical protein
MKKTIFKLFVLTVLLGGCVLIFGEQNQKAATPSCADKLFSKWNECDSNYSSARWTWLASPNTCQQSCTLTCSTIKDPAGRAQCESVCRNQCLNTAGTQFQNSQNGYGDCLSGAPSCREEPDICTAARQRFYSCAQYENSGMPELTALMNCRMTSGIDACE